MSKPHILVVSALLAILALTACVQATPTLAPVAPVLQPTSTPLPSVDTPSLTAMPATEMSTSQPSQSPAQGQLSSEVVYQVVAAKSKACYRVREQLVRFSFPNDAVGCTSDIEGQVVVRPDGTVVSERSRVQVNLGTLTSDESRRDRFVRRNTLQTDRYPHAVFVPKALIGVLSPLPTEGEVAFQVVGDLTIRDVTREVKWDVAATVMGARVDMEARTAFTFDEFQLERPQVPVVLSVEDPIRLEVSLVWERQ